MAAKIKDGLFIGDGDTSQIEDFINDNKISNLINLAGKDLSNLWAAHGLVYMTFHWEDRVDYKLNLINIQNNRKPIENDFIFDIIEFVDVSIKHGISVLMFSKLGKGRCIVAVCLYLMVKYKWGFEKSFEFIYSKKPDISLNRGFVQQLFAFDRFQLMKSITTEKQQLAYNNIRNEQHEPSIMINLLASAILTKDSFMRWKEWNPAYLSNSKSSIEVNYDNDELILIYSYLNSKVTINSLPGPYRSFIDAPIKRTKLKFSDIKYEEDINMFPNEPPLLTDSPIKSALKGSTAKEKNITIDNKIDSKTDKRSGSISKSIENNHKDNDIDLLYGFVGLMSNDNTNTSNNQSSNPSINDIDSNRKNSSNRLLTAEERLRKLVAGLSQPMKKSSDEDNNDPIRHESKDIDNNSNYDPLLAYDMMQKSGIVRAKPEINLPESERKFSSRKNAWVDINNSNSSNVSSSFSFSQTQAQQSWTPLNDQAQRTYRHGSPAPRSQQRSNVSVTTPNKPVNRRTNTSNMNGTLPEFSVNSGNLRFSIDNSSKDKLLDDSTESRRRDPVRQSLDRPDFIRRGSASSIESLLSEESTTSRPQKSSIASEKPRNMFSSPMRTSTNTSRDRERDITKTIRQPSPSSSISNSRRIPGSTSTLTQPVPFRSGTPTRAWKF